ncbi:MAG TPA: hypothetical protein VHB47_08400 [Thermoanaerobaculia bacterium]|jgi:hypothetical protein|nr:hypothetical protein [Thermoanaerobaculia bacterium]
MRRELLATFGPDRDGLLRKVSELVDDQMLAEIARAMAAESARLGERS